MKNKIKRQSLLRESWNYVRESRNYIWFALFVFLGFLIAGLIFPTPGFLEEQIKEIITKLASQIEGLNNFQLILFIFKNNLLVSLMAVFLGVIFCFVPVIIAASNGYVVGFVVKTMIEKLGAVDGTLSLWRILPHGIFELPAVIISLGLGIRLGVLAFESFNKGSFKTLKGSLKKMLIVVVYVILPLLIIAAIIEGILIGVLK